MNKVLVLMSTYNGERYLNVQIDSILKQEGVDVSILVRDDGSKDGTISLLRDYCKRFNNIEIIEGANCGAIWSFYKLMEYARDHYSNIKYFAFSDQDDFWYADKLSRAISKNVNDSDVYFYHSCYDIVDNELNLIHKTSSSNTLGSIGEALIANHSIGCSEVFTYSILEKSARICDYILDNPKYYPYHDLWVYLVAISVKANVYFDEYCSLKYRQHSNNVIGIRKSRWATLKLQFFNLIEYRKQKSGFATILLDLLDVDDDIRMILEEVSQYRKSFRNRFKLANNKSFRTKRRFHNLSFKFSVITGLF